MPILHVRALPQGDSVDIQAALQKTCIAIADVYGCDLNHVTATWEDIRPGLYIENGQAADRQPQSSHPPMAVLTCFEGKSAAQIEAVLLVTAQSLGAALNLGDNIFVTYQEAKSGQVVAGRVVVKLG